MEDLLPVYTPGERKMTVIDLKSILYYDFGLEDGRGHNNARFFITPSLNSSYEIYSQKTGILH